MRNESGKLDKKLSYCLPQLLIRAKLQVTSSIILDKLTVLKGLQAELLNYFVVWEKNIASDGNLMKI